MSLRVYTPFVFQGNLKNYHYFEGWYFKHVSGDQQNTWSFKESIDSEITLNLFDRQGNLIYNDTGKRAGLEVIDKIFDYL
jgi:hypothetical protein